MSLLDTPEARNLVNRFSNDLTNLVNEMVRETIDDMIAKAKVEFDLSGANEPDPRRVRSRSRRKNAKTDAPEAATSVRDVKFDRRNPESVQAIVLRALKEFDGNVSEAARNLGLSRGTVAKYRDAAKKKRN